MSTAAVITLGIAWGYILIMVLYFFAKVLKKDKESRNMEQQKPE